VIDLPVPGAPSASSPSRHVAVGYISTQTPAPQRWPAAHCPSLAQMQKPKEHCAFGPHWSFVEQVPQVPPTHASPPPH
jgi:hypothetical protein